MNASSWQAVWLLAVEVAAVVGLTWLIAWRLRSVVWQRTLWQAGLIALVGLLVVEFAALFPTPSPKETEAVGPVLEAKAEALEVQPAAADVPVTATELSIGPAPLLEPVPIITEPAGELVEVKVDAAVMEPSAAAPMVVPEEVAGFPMVLAIALGVWVVGSLVLAGRLLVGRFLLLRFCARSQSVYDVRLFDRVQGIAGKLGLKQGVQVLETERIQTPVVFGLFRLTIALPKGFTEKFERRQQEAILAHELAHLAARDPLWYLLADALVSVLWWHPLVWVARARLQVTSEMAADEACVLAKHGPETLAECLVSIAQEMHGQGALESIGIEGSGFRSRLGQRVERLLKLSAEAVSRPAVWRTRLVKVGMPVLLLAVLLVGSGWVRRDQSAPWSGLMSGAWNMMAGVLRVEEVDIKRDPRPILMAAANANTAVIPDPAPIPVPVLAKLSGKVKVQGQLPREAEVQIPENMKKHLITPITTRFYKVSSDWGLAYSVVYVKHGLEGKTTAAATEPVTIVAKGLQFQPYIAAAQTGQRIRFQMEDPVLHNLSFAPKNPKNKGWNKAMLPNTPVFETSIAHPERMARISSDTMPWAYVYLNVFEHPYFAVTDGEGRFEFAKPLPPGRYTLAVFHRQAGEAEMEVEVKGEGKPVEFMLEVGGAGKQTLKLKAETEKKLDELVLPELFMDGLPLEVALQYLMKESQRLDPEKKGLQMEWRGIVPAQNNGKGGVLRDPLGAPLQPVRGGEPGKVQELKDVTVMVNPVKKGLSFREVLKAVCEGAAVPLQYNIQNGVVVLTAKPNVREMKKAEGEVQPKAETRLAMNGKPILVGKRELNEETVKRLEKVKLPELFMDGLPLEITLQYLMEESVKKDPEKKGFKMIGRENVPFIPTADRKPVLNTSGLPVIPADAFEGSLDRPVGDIPILVNPVKKDLNFKQAIEAVCEGSLWPLTYQIEDGVIVFTAKPKAKLDAIQLRRKTFNQMPMVEVVRYLNETSVKQDETGKGVKFSVEGKFQLANGGNSDAEMTLVTREIPGETTLRQAIDLIVEGTAQPLEYVEKDETVIFRPKAGTPLLMRARVEESRGEMQKLQREEAARLFEVDVEATRKRMQAELDAQVKSKNAVSKLVAEGKQMYEQKKWDEAEVKLREAMKLDPANSAAFYYLKLTHEARASKAHIFSQGPYIVGTNQTAILSQAKKRIEAKLEQMVIKEVFFNEVPLAEVVRTLRAESVKLDPEGNGISFIIETAQTYQADENGLDPLGAPVPPAPPVVDLEKMMVKINPPLKNLRMIDALDAITKVATPVGKIGLAFTVGENGVVFWQTVIDPPQLYTRIFKVDLEKMIPVLEKHSGQKLMPVTTNLTVAEHTGSSGGSMGQVPSSNSVARAEQLQGMAKKYLSDQGVDFVSTNEAGGARTQIFINDRTGVLMARATLEDLRVIEGALEKLGATAEEKVWPNSSEASLPTGSYGVSILVQEAKRLIELRRMEEAEVKLREALKREPTNATAYYYMNLIQEARYSDRARQRDAEQRARITQVETAWEIPAGTNRLAVPNPYGQTNTIRGKMPLRNVILAKLNEMVIKELYFDGVPLTEVVRFLQEESVRQDPEKKGVRFIINSNLDDQPGSGGRTNSAVVDLEKAMITINPPLKNLRMIDAIDAITKVATGAGEQGLGFVVEDYAVVFRQRVIDPPQLYTRIFKVDKDKLIQGLEKQAGVKMMPLATNLTAVGTSSFPPSSAATNQGVQVTGYSVARSREFAHLAQQFFAACGVDMGTNGPGQASTQIFFNDRTGVLMALASLRDLELIAHGLEALGAVVDNLPIPSGISSAGSSVVRFYKFEVPAYVRGLERVTGKKVAEMSAAPLAAQVNGGRGTTNQHHVQWHQIELLTREFLLAQGADLSTGNFGLTYPQNPEAAQEVRWNVGGSAMAEEVFQRSSQRIMAEGKQDGEVVPLGRATNQVAIKPAENVRTNGTGTLAAPAITGAGSKDRNVLPTPNPYVRTNASQVVSKSRQRIESKLDQMVLKEVFFDGLPLAEVVRFLREESIKQDPEKVGINFVINSHLDGQPAGDGGKTLRDPLGAPLAPVVPPEDLRVVLVTINPPLKNLTMREMLSAITNATAQVGKHGLDYKVEDFGVTFRQRAIDPPQLFTRIFKAETNAFVTGLEKRMGMKVDAVTLTADELDMITNHTAASSQDLRMYKIQKLTRALFLREGVNFKLKTAGGAETQVSFNDRTGVLMVRATLEDLDLIARLLEAMGAGATVEGKSLPVPKPAAESVTRFIKFDIAPYVRGLERLTGKKVDELAAAELAKLADPAESQNVTNRHHARWKQIFILSKEFLTSQGADVTSGSIMPLYPKEPEALEARWMVKTSAENLEVIQKGIEKILEAGKDAGAAVTREPRVVTAAGASKPVRATRPIANEVPQVLKQSFKLRHETPTNIVRVIRGAFTSTQSTAIADTPNNMLLVNAPEQDMKRVEEIIRKLDVAANEVTPRAVTQPLSVQEEADERITKVFKVDADSSMNGFREMMKTSGFASTNLQEMMREFIRKSGVNLSEGNTNGTVVFLNDRTGVLLARAKPTEMQIIESAIEVLNIIPPQVEIQANYLVIPEKVAEEMGLKWFANGLPPDMSKPVAAMQLASASSSNRFSIQIDAPQVPNHVSILSPEQARELLKRLDDADGVDRLSAPRVTTVNKRQAQISVMEAMTVVVGRTNRVVKGEAGKKDSEEPVFITEQFAMGPMLDVIPNVYPDGKSMRLDWVFSLTEFVGYEKPEKSGELPTPLARRRQVANQNVIQDGYTLVAGCGMADIKTEAKKGLFRSGREKTEKKMVLILMKVNLLDPAGNYVNRE